jgi:hypothetical protein
MIVLFDAHSERRIGEVTEEEFAVMQQWLEEEGLDDEDYYIDDATVVLLEEKGADPALLAVLRRAIGANGEADIRWAQDDEGA